MLLQALTVAVIGLYFYLKYVYSYWDRIGISSIKPMIPFGNLKPVVTRELSFGMAINKLYEETSKPFTGIYLFFRPAILIREPRLIRKILTSDFSSFHDRGVYCDEERDPFSGNLFALTGPKWRILRNQITPTMTSGKIKSMYETIMNVANNLNSQLSRYADKNEIIDLRDFTTRYALDIIGNVIFGVELNTLLNPDHEFRKIHGKVLVPDFLTSLRGTCSFLCPDLLKFLRISSTPKWIKKWMLELIATTIKLREQQNFTRKDFLQLLIQLRNSGKVEADGKWEIDADEKLKELKFSIEQCAGHVFLFYVAGSDTSSNAISYFMHEISQTPTHLAKLQQEIDDGIKRYSGEVTYELVNELPFLEMCFQETLRKYPGLPILNRECTKDFEDPETNFKVKKGMQVVIPIYGIQRDPLYFKDPELFNPYRFEPGSYSFDENCYLPFGDGPHICIGLRMAKVVTKVALIKLLSNFNFQKTVISNLELETGTITIAAKNGVNLKISRRVETL